ncbi:hypothetical protein DVH24_039923 [Malus domestica]|uniref:C3H1-type domain-containing protein n=1 Tax=Malus domestica TaxID=3750 RepID=A0A498I6V4_MALDO|nr:hypothetical protein DVH24_039923 [Malus domestica]
MEGLWPKPSDHALKPQMMVVSDLDDVFVPLPDDLLVNLSESRSVAESMFQDNLCGDDLRVYGSDKEHPLRLLGDPFYKQMAAEFTKFQIEVDVYAFSDKYTDIGSLEQMWQLGLTSSESYPERPGVPNCVYYMRTGFFGYGGRCQYNHPRDRGANMVLFTDS